MDEEIATFDVDLGDVLVFRTEVTGGKLARLAEALANEDNVTLGLAGSGNGLPTSG